MARAMAVCLCENFACVLMKRCPVVVDECLQQHWILRHLACYVQVPVRWCRHTIVLVDVGRDETCNWMRGEEAVIITIVVVMSVWHQNTPWPLHVTMHDEARRQRFQRALLVRPRLLVRHKEITERLVT